MWGVCYLRGGSSCASLLCDRERLCRCLWWGLGLACEGARGASGGEGTLTQRRGTQQHKGISACNKDSGPQGHGVEIEEMQSLVVWPGWNGGAEVSGYKVLMVYLCGGGVGGRCRRCVSSSTRAGQ